MTDNIDEFGIDRTDQRVQPSGMTFERALAIAQSTIKVSPRQAQITEMHESGMSPVEIARAIGDVPKNVRQSLEGYGLIEGLFVPPRGFWTTDEGKALQEKIAEMVENGFPPREIAARHHLPTAVAQRRVFAARERRSRLDRRKELRQLRAEDAA